MEDTTLISKLKELKNISPRKEWVVLSKMQILETSSKAVPVQVTPGIMTVLQHMVFQKKFAYAYVALAILLAGSVGFMQFNLAGRPVASPEAVAKAKDSVETFKVKSQELARTVKNDPSNLSVAVNEVKQAAEELTETIKKDPGVAKEVALEINNNKTYLDVEGSAEAELKETSDILYQTVALEMIKDLEEASLTESQQEALTIAKDLYEKEKYTDALESILLLSMAIKEN